MVFFRSHLFTPSIMNASRDSASFPISVQRPYISTDTHFDRHSGDEALDLFQDRYVQEEWLQRILTALKTPVPEIALRNYENHSDQDIGLQHSQMLPENIAKATLLRISVTH
jgi:hypothetical protein